MIRMKKCIILTENHWKDFVVRFFVVQHWTYHSMNSEIQIIDKRRQIIVFVFTEVLHDHWASYEQIEHCCCNLPWIWKICRLKISMQQRRQLFNATGQINRSTDVNSPLITILWESSVVLQCVQGELGNIVQIILNYSVLKTILEQIRYSSKFSSITSMVALMIWIGCCF
jgi:hypothetical protein